MLTRRELLKTGGATFAGYALAPDVSLAAAIKTDTAGLVADEYRIPVGGFQVPVYEAQPATGSGHPILLVLSEI